MIEILRYFGLPVGISSVSGRIDEIIVIVHYLMLVLFVVQEYSQEMKIQELPHQVPVGHIPRSMTVIARGSLTRTVTAGENVTITGVFLPTPFTGVRAIKAGLIADTYIEAMDLALEKKNYDDYDLTEDMQELDAPPSQERQQQDGG